MFMFILSLALSFTLRSTAYNAGKRFGLWLLKRKARKAYEQSTCKAIIDKLKTVKAYS